MQDAPLLQVCGLIEPVDSGNCVTPGDGTTAKECLAPANAADDPAASSRAACLTTGNRLSKPPPRRAE
jgi:hypothetical protein